MPDREHATLRAWKPLWPPICCVEAQAPRRTPRRAKQYGAATEGAKRMVPSRAGGAAAAPQGCSCSWSSSPRSNYRRLSPPTARWGGASSLHYPRDTEKKQSWASSLSPRWIPERALSAARSMMGEMPNSGLPGAEGPPAEAAAKMIVFGVSFSTTKDAFREYWAQYGELAECELMFARDGRWG